MAALAARVLAFDYSEKFIERARLRSKNLSERIEYQVLDATDRQQLMALGRQRFDAAVCTMALMDMAAIEPLFESLHELLKPGGRFVFSVMHPSFNSSWTTRVIEEIDREGELVTGYAVKVAGYLTPTVSRGLGLAGQPAPHYYFHRPLSVLLGHLFQAGFTVDGLEECAFKGESQPKRAFSWANFSEIPPVLVVRARLAC
jgi:SAM-dependent methyltransferase